MFLSTDSQQPGGIGSEATRVDLAELGYIVSYVGGLIALVALAWPFDDVETSMAVAAGWSLLFGLMTTRYDALGLPALVVGGGTLLVLIGGGFDDWGSDTGPGALLLIPVLVGYVLAVLAVPMCVGILAARWWRALRRGDREEQAR